MHLSRWQFFSKTQIGTQDGLFVSMKAKELRLLECKVCIKHYLFIWGFFSVLWLSWMVLKKMDQLSPGSYKRAEKSNMCMCVWMLYWFGFFFSRLFALFFNLFSCLQGLFLFSDMLMDFFVEFLKWKHFCNKESVLYIKFKESWM